MIAVNLQGIAEQIVHRARRQGYVSPREVREELTQAGFQEELWKDVVAQTRPALIYQSGRYYFPVALSAGAAGNLRARTHSPGSAAAHPSTQSGGPD